ncbi:MAG: hypothetical protein H7Y88_03535 [Phycisphaerales bacterium]|nr:hypothetical protein [Phycisphaerales bacterium]
MTTPACVYSALPAVVAAFAAFGGLTHHAAAQLRVATWNISNFNGGREADLRTAIYGVFEGRALAPDAFATQEFLSQAAVDAFVAILNTAPGSPGDWAAAGFINGPDTDSAFFYRTTKVQYIGTTIIAVGSSAITNQPRNTYRYDFRPIGYASSPATLGLYSVHMKAQGGDNDAARRLIEAQRIRDNAEGVNTNGPGSALPAGYRFLMAGDTNIQTSAAPEYVELVGSQPSNTGRLFDPITSPGNWNNIFGFRFIHTQDPFPGGGGMDDRHDQILLCADLVDGEGMSYIGNSSIPYSTATWNDPNQSYRAWGNDGTTFNAALRVAGNTMVGPIIAQAIINSCASSGHLAVMLDLRVPPKGSAPLSIDFGSVPQGSTAAATLEVQNAGDVALWGAAGVADLLYSFSPPPRFGAPGGAFIEPPGGGAATHQLTLDTSTPGAVSGTLIITTNDPDAPELEIELAANIVAVPECDADWDGNGAVASADITAFLSDWFDDLVGGTSLADFNGSGQTTSADITAFLSSWFNELAGGC